MFLENKHYGWTERMSKQEREGYLEDVNDYAMVKKELRILPECELGSEGWENILSIIATLKRSLLQRVQRAFLNHPRPIKCTCGSYPCKEIIFTRKNCHIVTCENCGKSTETYLNYNVSILAWNTMISEQQKGNGGNNGNA